MTAWCIDREKGESGGKKRKKKENEKEKRNQKNEKKKKKKILLPQELREIPRNLTLPKRLKHDR